MIVFATINDRDAFQNYVEALGPIFKEYGATIVTRADPPIVLEGEWPWQTAGIVEFESAERAQAMWQSEAYIKAKQLRADNANFQVVVA